MALGLALPSVILSLLTCRMGGASSRWSIAKLVGVPVKETGPRAAKTKGPNTASPCEFCPGLSKWGCPDVGVQKQSFCHKLIPRTGHVGRGSAFLSLLVSGVLSCQDPRHLVPILLLLLSPQPTPNLPPPPPLGDKAGSVEGDPHW